MTHGIGHVPRRDYGVLLSCPHCTAVNIPKHIRAQITCGAERCRQKQILAKRKKRGE